VKNIKGIKRKKRNIIREARVKHLRAKQVVL